MQLPPEAHDTPFSWVSIAPVGFGVVLIFQAVPFHDSAQCELGARAVGVGTQALQLACPSRLRRCRRRCRKSGCCRHRRRGFPARLLEERASAVSRRTLLHSPMASGAACACQQSTSGPIDSTPLRRRNHRDQRPADQHTGADGPGCRRPTGAEWPVPPARSGDSLLARLTLHCILRLAPATYTVGELGGIASGV
jgi:hypothetical protein